MTLRNLFSMTFTNNLYIHPTKEIVCKSFKHCELPTLGMRAIKVELIPFVSFLFWWNSVRKRKKSSLSSLQNSYRNSKLIPSGPRLLISKMVKDSWSDILDPFHLNTIYLHCNNNIGPTPTIMTPWKNLDQKQII